MSRAVVLLAHGARSAAWAEPFEHVATALRAARPALPVHLAFLEFMAPDLPTALATLAAQGVREIDLLPLFLGGAGHVLRDVPPLLEAARATHGLQIHLHPALGQQPAMVAAIAAVCAQQIEQERP